MKKFIQKIKGFFVIALVMLSLFLAGCCSKLSDTYYWTEYKITNMRIDDDAEYHITYQSKRGTIYSEHDLGEYDITVSRANISYPILKKKNNKHCDCFGNISDNEEPPFKENRELIIPIDYKIETFDD